MSHRIPRKNYDPLAVDLMDDVPEYANCYLHSSERPLERLIRVERRRDDPTTGYNYALLFGRGTFVMLTQVQLDYLHKQIELVGTDALGDSDVWQATCSATRICPDNSSAS